MWKDISFIKGYQASDEGYVRNAKSKRVLKPSKIYGYHRFNIGKTSYSVHGVVARTFLPLPSDPSMIVNHLDGDKINNKVKNLRFCTLSENTQHAVDTGLITYKTRKVDQYSLDGEYITTYDSITSASIATGLDVSGITKVCKKKRKFCGNFIWKHTDPDVGVSPDTQEWKVVNSFPNYKVSNKGEVANQDGHMLSQYVDAAGYHSVQLTNGDLTKRIKIHILVTQHYLPTSDPSCVVNHKNGKRGDNSVENLELVSQAQNVQHAHDTGLNRTGKSVVQLDLNGNELKTFKNIREAYEHIGLVYASGIGLVCKGKQKTCAGYGWKFATPILTRTLS